MKTAANRRGWLLESLEGRVLLASAINPIADAYVRDGTYAATNYGSVTALQVKTGSSSYNRDAYFKFDLSGVSSVTNAKLRVYANASNTSSISVGVYAVADTSWSETAITWNNKPALGTQQGAAVSFAGTTYAWRELDVTSYVQSEKAAGRNTITLALHAPSSVSPNANVNSREASTNKPELLIDAVASTTVSAPSAPSGLAASASSSSQINISWTDNSSNETSFKIERKTGSSGTWSQIGTVGSNTTSFSNTGLTASTTYYYRVRASNSGGDSAYSNEAYATTTSSSPGGTVVNPTTVVPTSSTWESGYQSRLAALVGARTWSIGAGTSDADAGKRDWPALLAEMWKVRNDPTAVQNFINNQGRTLIFSRYAGSFYKPFSAPGYTLYYMKYKNLLPQEQKDKVAMMFSTPDANGGTAWNYMMRTDGYMDPIYSRTEFNSENFNWMARLMGYLWAEEFNDASKLTYFRGYVNNWIRSLYNAGRVEWNSNNYWGYTFQPILVLYEFAKDPQVKRQAKAALDWMVTEAATHYLDGFEVGPDSRAKTNAHKAFAGSTWAYAYYYFPDTNYHPTFSQSTAVANVGVQEVGYAPYSSYRPAQAIINIAQRRFTAPIEMRNAKPFYHLDNENYADWAGNTTRSRRFEFETLYLEQNYTLGSLATYRPNGDASHLGGQKPFSEHNVWRLGVKGSTNGAIQVFGNTGADNDHNGRNPYEEIGQYRNVMMRLIKGASRMWVAFPDSKTVEFSGNTAFVDIGSDVYVAVIPYNTTGRSSADATTDTSYTQHIWNFSSSALGGLVMEVGTRAEHGSYASFKTNIANTSLSSPAANQLEFIATSGRRLTLEWQPTTTYTMVDGAVINPAGVPPKVWADGVLLNFGAWNSFEVSYGQNILEQDWGSGVMNLSSGGSTLRITVNPSTADVEYRVF